jgi:uncharacterized membrane protein YgdD (TMEM256/DUF423 family)
MARTFFTLSGVVGFLGVALGAFGAHALRSRLAPDLLAVYQTGVQYHLVHAVALLGIAAWMGRGGSGAAALAGWLFLAGIALFSGSLYALALSGVRALGAVTPLGGIAFLGGWAALVWEGWRAARGS